VFTRALHWSLSWARSIQSTPSHPISLRSILILSIQLRLGLPSGLFPSGFPTNILYAFLVSHIRATCPAHLILLPPTTPIIKIELCLSSERHTKFSNRRDSQQTNEGQLNSVLLPISQIHIERNQITTLVRITQLAYDNEMYWEGSRCFNDTALCYDYGYLMMIFGL
jgi:hypothetical protein